MCECGYLVHVSACAYLKITAPSSSPPVLSRRLAFLSVHYTRLHFFLALFKINFKHFNFANSLWWGGGGGLLEIAQKRVVKRLFCGLLILRLHSCRIYIIFVWWKPNKVLYFPQKILLSFDCGRSSTKSIQKNFRPFFLVGDEFARALRRWCIEYTSYNRYARRIQNPLAHL